MDVVDSQTRGFNETSPRISCRTGRHLERRVNGVPRWHDRDPGLRRASSLPG